MACRWAGANKPSHGKGEHTSRSGGWRGSQCANATLAPGTTDGNTINLKHSKRSFVRPGVMRPRSRCAHGCRRRHHASDEHCLATIRTATVTTPDGTAVPVILRTADGLRMTPHRPCLDANTRHLVGTIEIPAGAYATRESNPFLDTLVRDWLRGNHIPAITLSATDHDLVVR